MLSRFNAIHGLIVALTIIPAPTDTSKLSGDFTQIGNWKLAIGDFSLHCSQHNRLVCGGTLQA
jgi:hypothetical protein